MSGRRRTQMRRALSFFVSAFVGVLLLASPLAWGEGLLSKGEQSSVSTQQKAAADGEHKASGDNQDTNTSDAHVQENAPDGCEGVKASDTDEQGSDSPDSKTDAAPAEAGKEEMLTEPKRSYTETDSENDASMLGDTQFRASIKIGGKEVPCVYQTMGDEPNCCRVGSLSTTAGALDDKTISGDLEIPERVMFGKTEYKVTHVGDYAFKDCVNITSTGLATNTTMEKVGNYSFAGCISLKSTGLEESKSVYEIQEHSFQGCTNLKTTGLENNTTISSIRTFAFSGCTALKSTGLERKHLGSQDKLTSISPSTFQGCTSLISTGLDHNTAIKTLDTSVFQDCTSLPSTGLEGNNTLTSLSSSTFQGCTSLKSTGFDHNTAIKTLYNSVFQGCTSLTSTGLDHNTAIKTLGTSDFQDCTSLPFTGLEENTTLTSLSSSTFQGCTSLKSTAFDHNSTIKTLGSSVFRGCTSLISTGLEVNTKISILASYTFYGCTALTSTGLGSSSVTSVGYAAFVDCTALTSAGLAGNDKLNDLGGYVFQRCTALTATGLEGCHNVSSLGEGCFAECSSLGQLPDVTGATNTGDLVMNQPRSGKQISIGAVAFRATHIISFYLIDEGHPEKPRIPTFGSNLGSSIQRIYVSPSWWGTTGFSTGGRKFSISDGTLVIMSPTGSMTAKRKEGTSDVATASIRVGSSFKGQITDSQGHVLKDFSADLASPNPTQVVDIDTDEGTGLVPSKEQLGMRATEPGSYTYPSWAKVRPYNTETYNLDQTPFVCDLAATTYTIHFDGNGSTSGSESDLAMTYDVAKLLNANSYKRDKYQFMGWNTQADGSGEAYTDKQQVLNLTTIQGEKVILYAQWKRIVSMTLSISGSGGGAFAGYVLSATEGDREHGVDNVYTDSGKKTQATWPQKANKQANLTLYGLTPGTYYLYNTQAPAGYLLSKDAHCFTINDKAEVVIDGQGEPKELTNDKIIVSFSFTPAPDLPQTGSSERGLLQGLGVLLALGITGVAVRALRHKIKG